MTGWERAALTLSALLIAAALVVMATAGGAR